MNKLEKTSLKKLYMFGGNFNYSFIIIYKRIIVDIVLGCSFEVIQLLPQ